MPLIKNRPFPCDACGQCCRNVHLSNQTSYLDRGDGTCVHFNDSTLLCEIYESRPLICRVEAYYTINLSHIYTWEEFIQINSAICAELKN